MIRGGILIGMLMGGALLPGCTDVPPDPSGSRVSGTIAYRGQIHRGMKRPAVRVMANLEFPPTDKPFGLRIIEPDEAPGFPTSIPYELKGLDPYRYRLFAQLVDLAGDGYSASLPLGGYPDVCALLSAETGWVNLQDSLPVARADFQLYDQAGAEDPCNTATSVCPLAGRSSLNLLVRTERAPMATDRLLVGLFATFPSLIPGRSRNLPGTSLAFPQTILDNGIAPGDYPALYICLDVNGDSGTGLCTSEDAYVLATPSLPIAFPADRVVTILVDLDAQSLEVVSVTSPADHGCGDPAP